jgi:transcription initiation factor IIE alpha subunit
MTDSINLAVYQCSTCLINHTYQLRHHRGGPCPLCGKELEPAGKEDQVRRFYQPVSEWNRKDMI